MSNPDIDTVKDLDLDFLRKSEHFRIGNKVYVRIGNTDGEPLKVIQDIDATVENLLVYDEANAVEIQEDTTLIEYIVPPNKILELESIEVSGTNFAKYTVYINGNKNKSKRTHTGASLNENFSYNNYKITEGITLKVEVVHNQDLGHTGNFNTTIEGKLRDA